jgi:hypothetical protein
VCSNGNVYNKHKQHEMGETTRMRYGYFHRA